MSFTKPAIQSVHFSSLKARLPSLEGKTVVITGTTSGTGRAAAEAMTEKGARLIMLNRASERSARVQQEISAAYPSADVSTIACDLMSFASVRSATAELTACCEEGLYALVNNAGIMAMPDEATSEGFDTQMQVNHLSHFLLTRDLMPLLEKGAERFGEARIVNHSSIARLSVKTLEPQYLEQNGGNLGGNGASMFFGGARWVRYGQTKLANAAFTAALHHKLQASGSKVKALVAHPGLANTELQNTTSNAGGMGGWSTSLMMKWFAQSSEDGALGILSCACLPEAKSGEFYGPGSGMMAAKGEAKPFALEARYDNESTRALLWDKSCAAIGGDFDL